MISDPGPALVAEQKAWFTSQRKSTDSFRFLDELKATKYSMVTWSLCVEMHLSSGDKIMNETVNIHLNMGKPVTASYWTCRLLHRV